MTWPSGVIVPPIAPNRIALPVESENSRTAAANGAGNCCASTGIAVSGVTIRSAGFAVIIC